MERRVCLLLLLVLVCALLVRWCVSLYPHSGYDQPPHYGDYEAQRHWMEITYHLPLADWYRDTPANRLQYWGLDYPPLTAYHSWVCGAVAHRVNPAFVALHSSRGLESPPHRHFMRATVLLGDALLLLPAAVLVSWSLYGRRQHTTSTTTTSSSRSCAGGGGSGDSAVLACTMAVLLCPLLILVDHGHFQYNSVSLALALLAVACAARGRHIGTALCFTLALNHKHMELYHALPFFSYLLGESWRVSRRDWLPFCCRVLALGATVVGVFSVLWLPLVVATPGGALPILRRLFPLERGLYEDKVANVWCSLAPLYKVQQHLSRATLVPLCALLTVAAALPSNWLLLRRPSLLNLRYALVNTSLAFFLCAYHVHEKSVLLAVVPAALLVVDCPLPVLWLTVAATGSVAPLLVRDGLVAPLVATTVLYVVAVGWVSGVVRGQSAYRSPRRRSLMTLARATTRVLDEHVVLRQAAFLLSTLGYALLITLLLTVTPPQRYPDIWPVLIALYSFLHFVGFFLYFHLLQYRFVEEKLKVT